MTPESFVTEGGNRCYQDELAAALVAALGLDGAIALCQNNGWDGVLGALLGRAFRRR